MLWCERRFPVREFECLRFGTAIFPALLLSLFCQMTTFERRMLANIRRFFNGLAVKSCQFTKFSGFFAPSARLEQRNGKFSVENPNKARLIRDFHHFKFASGVDSIPTWQLIVSSLKK